MPTAKILPFPSTIGAIGCAIYIRVSTSNQEDNYSLDTQEASCRAYAAERGWQVVDVFRDVYTGADLFDRPGLSRMREVIRSGGARMVLAHALDRVSRNQAHLGFLLSEWDHIGVGLELVTEDISNTPEGRLLQSVRSFVAEVERLKIGERSWRGVQARVASGKPMPGQKAPFGYRWIDNEKSRMEIDPETSVIAMRIFRSVLEGNSLRSLAMALTAEGVPTSTGKSSEWRVSSIQRLLSNPAYKGESYAFRTAQQRRNGGHRTIYKPKSEWIRLPDSVVPPLLSVEEFDAIQARLAYNKATAPRNNVDPAGALLRCGVARCGYCGYPLAVTRRKNRDHMYRCHPVNRLHQACPSFGVMAPILDSSVWEKVELVLRQPEVIAQEVERRKTTEVLEADLTSIDRRIAKIGEQRARLARAIALLEDEAAAEPLLNELQSLSNASKVLDAERVGIESRKSREAEIKQKLLGLSEWCSRVAGNLPTLTYLEKRMVLEALGVSVEVFRADHEPRWEITMAPLPVEPAADGSIVTATGTAFTTAIPG